MVLKTLYEYKIIKIISNDSVCAGVCEGASSAKSNDEKTMECVCVCVCVNELKTMRDE